MRFDTGRSIYEQIVDHAVENILTGAWKPQMRVPSVRELAVELEVNPNTVQRSYARLQDLGLLFNQRGVGYFVAPEAPARAREQRTAEFERVELPAVFRTMQLIDWTDADLVAAWRRFLAHAPDADLPPEHAPEADLPPAKDRNQDEEYSS